MHLQKLCVKDSCHTCRSYPGLRETAVERGVSTVRNREIQLSQLTLESEPNRPVTMEEIEKVFVKLPSPKTPGPDGVSG